MTKPTYIPRWATGAGAAMLSSVPAGLITRGFRALEAVPAELLNKLLGGAGDWCQWLNDFEATAHTWLAQQVFNGVALDDATAVIKTDSVGATPGSARKLLWQIGAVGTYLTRIYATSANAYEVTFNARWDGSLGTPAWVRDGAIFPSLRAVVTNDGKFSVAYATSASWVDAAWRQTVAIDKASAMKWTDTQADADGANPPASTGLTNDLRAKNVCKAWGNVRVTFPAGSPVATMQDGVNAACSFPGVNTTLHITFATAMRDANYSVALASDLAYGGGAANPPATPRFLNKTSAGFDIQLLAAGGGGPLVFNGTVDVDFIVFGRQDS